MSGVDCVHPFKKGTKEAGYREKNPTRMLRSKQMEAVALSWNPRNDFLAFPRFWGYMQLLLLWRRTLARVMRYLFAAAKGYGSISPISRHSGERNQSVGSSGEKSDSISRHFRYLEEVQSPIGWNLESS